MCEICEKVETRICFPTPRHYIECLKYIQSLVDSGSFLFELKDYDTDKVKDIEKIYDNLYLVNLKNTVIKKIIMEKVQMLNKNKYIQFYSTDYNIPLKELQNYIAQGFKVIYEYIDDMSPEIVGTNEIPKNMLDKYNNMLQDKENVFVIVTADRLEKDIIEKRGKEKLAFSCNGVDYEHFNNINTEFKFDKDFENILKMKKPIIGYYGALANWMDYDLVKYYGYSPSTKEKGINTIFKKSLQKLINNNSLKIINVNQSKNINNYTLSFIKNNKHIPKCMDLSSDFVILTDEEMKEACRLACIDEYIETLPEKYETIVGEGGVILSGGQRQRLAIARAFVQKTEIILFDEATSALDNESEQIVKKSLDLLAEGRTTLIVAHRLTTIKNADIILVMQHGDIIEQGTHNELMQKESGV